MFSLNSHETQKNLLNFYKPTKFTPNPHIEFNIKFMAYHHFTLS